MLLLSGNPRSRWFLATWREIEWEEVSLGEGCTYRRATRCGKAPTAMTSSNSAWPGIGACVGGHRSPGGRERGPRGLHALSTHTLLSHVTLQSTGCDSQQQYLECDTQGHFFLSRKCACAASITVSMLMDFYKYCLFSLLCNRHLLTPTLCKPEKEGEIKVWYMRAPTLRSVIYRKQTRNTVWKV